MDSRLKHLRQAKRVPLLERPVVHHRHVFDSRIRRPGTENIIPVAPFMGACFCAACSLMFPEEGVSPHFFLTCRPLEHTLEGSWPVSLPSRERFSLLCWQPRSQTPSRGPPKRGDKIRPQTKFASAVRIHQRHSLTRCAGIPFLQECCDSTEEREV
jgi:hypothetical protein